MPIYHPCLPPSTHKVVTGFGCFALDGDPDTLRLTAWGVAHSRWDHDLTNATEDLGQISYIGLRRFVVTRCTDTDDSSRDPLAWSNCRDKAIWWSEAECSSGQTSYYGFPCAAIDECRDAAVNNQFGAFMTCE